MNDYTTESVNAASAESPLEGWKEIAAYLQRDVRTVSRWEKKEGLPVRRHQHEERSTVYAFPSELDRWREERTPVQPQQEVGDDSEAPRSYWPWAIAASALLAAYLLITGPILNPPAPLVDAAGSDGIVARQVWGGSTWTGDDTGGPSPDGSHLAYVDWEIGGLKLRNIETGETTVLVSGDTYSTGRVLAAAFRPDGKAIAYVWDNYGAKPEEYAQEIRLLGVNDDWSPGEMRTLYSWPNALSLHGWSLDGKKLLAVLGAKDRTKRIATILADTGDMTVLKTTGWEEPAPVFSPDARWVAYDISDKPGSPKNDIVLLSSDGDKEVAAVSHPADDTVVCWSPDGRTLFFTSDRTGTMGLYGLPVQADGSTGEPRLVKAGTGAMRALAPPIDGKLYYSVITRMKEIWLADLAGVGDQSVKPHALASSIPGGQSGPAFSPDGKALAYFVSRRPRENSTRVVIRDLETGAETSFGHESTNIVLRANYSPLSFSPDSSKLLYQGWDRRGRRVLALTEVETGATRVVPYNEDDRGLLPLGWLTDKTILVRRNVRWTEEGRQRFTGTLAAVNVETGEADERFRARTGFMHAALSPDRRQVLVPQINRMEGAGKRSLIMVNADGVDPHQVLEIPDGKNAIYSIGWPENQKTAYFTTNFKLWRGDFETREIEEIPLDIDSRIYTVVLHPDGRRFAVEAGVNHETEIWTLENFITPAPTHQERAQ